MKFNFTIVKKFKIWYKYMNLRLKVKRTIDNLNRALGTYPDEATTAIKILKTRARKKTSEVLYAPVSGDFYIINDGDNYIIFKNDSLSIIDGVSYHYVNIPEEATANLDKYLKRIVERRRSKIRKEIESKITRSLKDILDHALEE